MLYFFSFSGLISGIVAIIFGLFVYFKNQKSIINRSYGLLSFSIAIWGIAYYFWPVATQKEHALLSFQLLHVGAILIAPSFLWFILSLLDLHRKFRKIIIFSFLIGVFFLIVAPTRLFIKDMVPLYIFNFWAVPGITYHFYLIFWYGSICFAWFHLVKQYKYSVGIKRNQLKYVLIASLLGFLGGGTNYLLWYKIYIPPLGTFLVGVHVIILAYAIARYRLMDIRVAIARGAIFTVVYAVVLGFPFWIAYQLMGAGKWFMPMVIMAILASTGPFIYNYLRRQAEARLLAEEHRAHQLLTSASEGMTRIRELKKLLDLIVHITTRILKLDNAAIFLLDNERKKYDLKAIRLKTRYSYLGSIDANDILIQKMIESDQPLIYEEIKMQARTDNNPLISEMEKQMRALGASLIAPSSAGDRLLGFLILGEKKSGRMYTQDDVNLLNTLANQAALAIENALFYQEDAERKALLYQSAILSELGVMADSMGHQIKNHIQKMMADAGVQSAFVEEYLNKELSNQQLKDALTKIKSTLDKIELQGKKGGELIESIRKFSHLPTQAFKELKLKETFDLANEVLSFKIRFDELDYMIDIPETLPLFYGHPVISEVWVNTIDNGNDAIKEKEELLTLEAKKQGKEAPAFRGRIEFKARQLDQNHIQIKITDNGIGIKKENLSHLFLPFYTTKATSAKGTGLGLYVIKNIINNHKGKIDIDSEYMQGTTFTITLPIRQ